MPGTSICVGWRRSIGPTRLQHSHYQSGPGYDGFAQRRRSGKSDHVLEYPAGVERPPVCRHDAGQLAGVADLQDLRSVGYEATVQLAGQLSFSATEHDSPFDDRQPLNPNSEINTAEPLLGVTAKVSGGYVLPYNIVARKLRASSRGSTGAASPVWGRHRPSNRLC